MDYVNTVFAFKLFEELWDYFLFITFFPGTNVLQVLWAIKCRYFSCVLLHMTLA